MPVTTIDGREVHVDAEGFLTDPSEWDEGLGKTLAAAIGIDMTEDHWKVIRFLREDFQAQGETATTRRVTLALSGAISVSAVPILRSRRAISSANRLSWDIARS